MHKEIKIHLLCLLHIAIVISSYPRWHQMSTKAQNTIILSSVTSCHLIEYWLVWPQAQIILVDHVYFFVMVFHLYKTKIGLKFTFLCSIDTYKHGCKEGGSSLPRHILVSVPWLLPVQLQTLEHKLEEARMFCHSEDTIANVVVASKNIWNKTPL